ncbi:hypothetical protein N0V90_004912 [Kalmusia sp. IMI 367209]|nr:hypothetical protein N0V90_004912 [Kalmusia sp. IMI 367209]
MQAALASLDRASENDSREEHDFNDPSSFAHNPEEPIASSKMQLKASQVPDSQSHTDLRQHARRESLKSTMENMRFSFVSAPLASTPPRAAATFENLPGELRNQVYRLLSMGSDRNMVVWDNRVYNTTAVPDRISLFKSLPGLAYVNRRTYVEFVAWLLSNKSLEIHILDDLRYLEDTLEWLPDYQGWDSVKNLKFTLFSDLATSPARTRELYDCVARCCNIQELTLQFKLDLLHMPEHDPAYRQFAFLNGGPGIKSSEQVALNYELDSLLDLPHLRKLTMICEWHRNGPVRCTPRTMATFWDLQDWIAQEFSKINNVTDTVKSLPFDDPKESGAWTVLIKRGKNNGVA